MDEFKFRILRSDYHIVSITESWATANVTDAELSIAGYSMIRKDRSSDKNSKGGGVILYVKDSLVHTPVESLNEHSFGESAWCHVELSTGKLLVGVCYRSTASDQQNNNQLLQLLNEATKIADKSHLLIMGDFNFPEIDYNGYEVHALCGSDATNFFDMTQDLFLSQHVHDHTRFRQGQNPSLLDYIFTYEENQIDNLIHQAPVAKSDHACLSFDYVAKANECTFSGCKFDYHKGDYTSIIAELQCIEWEKVLHSKGCEETWRILRDIITALIEKHIPVRSGSANKSRHRDSWIQRRTVKEIKRREAAWRRYKTFSSERNYTEYKKVRNKVTAMIRQDHQTYQRKLVQSFKQNQKKFYAYVRTKQSVKTKVCRILKSDGSRTSSDKETADVLGEQFQSVFFSRNGN